MHFTIVAKDLKAPLEAIAGLTDTKSHRPALSSTLVTATADGQIELAGTDLNDAFWFQIKTGTVHEPGQVLLPSVNFLKCVRQAEKDQIHLRTEKTSGRVRLEFGSTKIQLPTEVAEDFPKIGRFDPTAHYATVGLDHLIGLAKRTNFATEGTFKLRVMAGAKVEIRAKSLRITSTDGIRMAVAEHDLVGPSAEQHASVVGPLDPKILKSLSLLDTDPVHVQLANQVFRLRGTRGDCTQRTLQGRFADFDPESRIKHTAKIDLPTKDLLHLLETASLLKTETFTDCVFTLDTQGFHLNAASSTEGEVQTHLSAPWAHTPLTIKLDAAFLADAVKAVKTPTVNLAFGTANEPIMLREETPGGLYLYVLGPRF